MNKQPQVSSVDTIQTSNMLELYGTNAYIIHYMLHNLFRGLKPVRRKYKLTINEIIILNGIYLYCKHVNTCMSQDVCLRFIGYYNLNKIKYYIGSLLGKGMIEIAEVINSYNRYKTSILGLSVINDISAGFDSCLYKWFQKYNICLLSLSLYFCGHFIPFNLNLNSLINEYIFFMYTVIYASRSMSFKLRLGKSWEMGLSIND